MIVYLSKIMYPKDKDIEVRHEVVDPKDELEECFYIKVNGQTLITLTYNEMVSLVDKGEFALKDYLDRNESTEVKDV